MRSVQLGDTDVNRKLGVRAAAVSRTVNDVVLTKTSRTRWATEETEATMPAEMQKRVARFMIDLATKNAHSEVITENT